MPELPEVEAVRRKLDRDARGSTIRRATMLRKRDRRLVSGVRNRTIRAVERRGKHLLIRLSSDLTIHVHLRMTGNLYTVEDFRIRPATVRAWFELTDGRGILFDDPRTLGVLKLIPDAELPALSASLGPEPLSEQFTPEAFVADCRRSRRPAKLYLLDQSKIAGLGNIYAAESLYRARVHPAKPMNRLSSRKLARLHAAIVSVLADAVESTCNAYSGPGRYNSAETFAVAVYGREGLACFACGRLVRRIPQGGRSTYYCPGCQR